MMETNGRFESCKWNPGEEATEEKYCQPELGVQRYLYPRLI